MKDLFGEHRPLSPHLQIYRLPLTVVLSILHRISGVFLAFAYAVFVVLICLAAVGEDAYLPMQSLLSGWFGKLMLLLATMALYFHLCAGVRHLFWDAGVGFELRTVDRSAVSILLVALLLTVLTWSVYFLM